MIEDSKIETFVEKLRDQGQHPEYMPSEDWARAYLNIADLIEEHILGRTPRNGNILKFPEQSGR